MKTLLRWVAVAWLVGAGSVAAGAAQVPQAAQGKVPAASADKSLSQREVDRRAEAYYAFTMGHLYEEYYEASSRTEYANLAIEFYKKAYELDPSSAVIRERLAEIYFKSQRIRDAVLEIGRASCRERV